MTFRYRLSFTGVPWKKLWAARQRLIRQGRTSWVNRPTRGDIMRAAYWLLQDQCPRCGERLQKTGGLKAYCNACDWVWGQDT